jgi:arsenate reductase
MIGDIAVIHSAGVNPANEIHPMARRVMAEEGVDFAGQYPKHVDNYLGQEFDIIITVCDHAREHCPFFPGQAQRLHWGLNDPAKVEGTEEERLAAFRETVAELRTRLREIVPLIKKRIHQRRRG